MTSTTLGAYDQEADYVTLQLDVPIRIEQPELEVNQAADVKTVSRWTGWVLPTIANAPLTNDRFLVPGKVLKVNEVEDLTDLEDGTLDHYQLDLEEILVADPG